jgi:hypothetical protein
MKKLTHPATHTFRGIRSGFMGRQVLVGGGTGWLRGCPDKTFQRNMEIPVEAADHFQG